MKYSDQFVDWLVEEGYTHCFFVAGGNIMHLLDSVRTRMSCVPVVHEVAAGVAAEYFNELRPVGSGKAFALVTAGPGLTNILTAMAGAFLESRELLVIGGQVKSSDLADGGLRQRGIQEVDGVGLAEPVSKRVLQIRAPHGREEVLSCIREGAEGRPGPVFIEFCLDAQAAAVVADEERGGPNASSRDGAPRPDVEKACDVLLSAQRPVLLLGGGLSREAARMLGPTLELIGIPLATTWNGADRVMSTSPLYFGRPNTWGMRWSNVLIQQSDAVVAVGSRLGLQQTGFNWQGFAPGAAIVHVDIDEAELDKGHPASTLRYRCDAGAFLEALTQALLSDERLTAAQKRWADWLAFGGEVRGALPMAEAGNTHGAGYIDPYEFMLELGATLTGDEVIVPCSSGGAFTVTMQALELKGQQRMATDKGLASMGYGLSGAIGASLANPQTTTVLIEGDGGFTQNLQELGTVAAQQPRLKIFIFANEGYASIRMTQRNYFGGAYLGCDTSTGLGMPSWEGLFAAYGITCVTLGADERLADRVEALLAAPEPCAFIVTIDPEQTYFPKINSRVTADGGMESSPLHLMHPPLDDPIASAVLKYL